jgi:hypothetical protein
MRRKSLSVLLVLVLTVAGCAGAPPASHSVLQAGAEPLRSQFNRDAGHVRIVILAAPT